MEVKFHRDVNHNYMMLPGGEIPDPDAYENRVILANRIRGLLPCRLLYLNGDTYYSFEITSMQSLEFLRGRRILSGEGFTSFLYELIDILCGLEEYLLDFDHLVLSPDKIYIDPSGRKIGLVYFPAYRKDVKESLRELVEYLLSGTDPDDRRTTLFGYRVYHALQKEELLLGELRGLLTESGNDVEIPERSARNGSPGRDAVSSGLQEYAGMHTGEDGDRRYSEAYHHASESDMISYGKTEKVPKLAITVFLTVGLLSAAITYAFLHLGLGRILAEHSDLLIRISGACAIAALFAAAFHFAGKSRKMGTQYAGVPEEGSLRYGSGNDPEPGLREAPEVPPDKVVKSINDLQYEVRESFMGPNREISPGEPYEEEFTCQLRRGHTAGSPGPSARLVPDKETEDSGENTEILLHEGTVIIGKSGDFADRVISRNTVSRVHARIRFFEDAYWLMDLNSRNGTFKNGELLPGGEEVEISDGDEISFADAGYRVHMDRAEEA